MENENIHTIILDFESRADTENKRSPLCLAIMGLDSDRKHNFFQQFSEEEYRQFSTLSIDDDLGNRLSSGEAIKGFELLSEITHKAVREMELCLDLNPGELDVEYTSRSKESAQELNLDSNWHKDAYDESMVGKKVILNYIGAPTLVVPHNEAIYKKKEGLALVSRNFDESLIGDRYEMPLPGEAVVFEMGGDGAIHAASESENQRLLVAITYNPLEIMERRVLQFGNQAKPLKPIPKTAIKEMVHRVATQSHNTIENYRVKTLAIEATSDYHTLLQEMPTFNSAVTLPYLQSIDQGIHHKESYINLLPTGAALEQIDLDVDTSIHNLTKQMISAAALKHLLNKASKAGFNKIFGTSNKENENDFKNLDKKLKTLHTQFVAANQEYLASEALKVIGSLDAFNKKSIPKGQAAKKVMKEDANEIYKTYKELVKTFNELAKETGINHAGSFTQNRKETAKGR